MSIPDERIKEIFLAVKFHFTSKTYDFFKYHGKVKTKKIHPQENVAIGKLKRKFSDEQDLIDFFAISAINLFLERGEIPSFIGEYATKEMVASYEKLKSRRTDIEYYFAQDIKRAKSGLKPYFEVDKTGVPAVFQDLIDGDIQLHSFMAILKLYPKLATYWETKSDDTLFFIPQIRTLNKYTKFLEINKENFKKILDSQV